jgi:hypothetical protein
MLLIFGVVLLAHNMDAHILGELCYIFMTNGNISRDIAAEMARDLPVSR